MEGEEGLEAEVVGGDFLEVEVAEAAMVALAGEPEAPLVVDAVVVVTDLIGETNLLFDDIFYVSKVI